MKISKHLHSCLLVEAQEKTILLDPGNYTYDNHALNIQSLEKLDYIAITHAHPDHIYIPFLKELIAKFPDVQIFSNTSVQDILGKENIQVNTQGNDSIQIEEVPHEKIWMGNPGQNVMITLFNKLSHPGDSLSFSHSAEILALPIQAPWGSTTWAVEKALAIKPKVIIPIHDYHWKDEVRKGMYERLEQYFGNFGIIFKKPETGEIMEV
jgi:L-ascorbate metabolism protein UlaG (beta-lactamase superfamily)